MTDIARERRLLAAQGLDIITRETWDAVESYTSDRAVFEPVEGFVLHISVTIDHGDLTGHEHADMRTIERIGEERFGIGFPYNAAVFDTRRLYEGQPLTRRGAHTVDNKGVGYKSTGSSRSMNFWWRAICLPQMVTDDVTDGQVDQCARWAAAQIRAGIAKRDAIWIGHRDVAWKGCPGDTGYARLPEIRRLTEHYVRNGLTSGPEHNDPPEDDDMFLLPLKGTPAHALVGPGYWHNLGQSEIDDAKALGIPVKPAVDRARWDRSREVFTAGTGTQASMQNAVANVLEYAAAAGKGPLQEIVKDALAGGVDEAEVARLVLAGFDPAKIAEAIPADLAVQVADELGARLAN